MLKRNEISSHEKTWRKEGILLSERSQHAKVAHSMVPTMTFWERQKYDNVRKPGGCQGLQGRTGSVNRWISRAVKILCII